jgi:ribosomal subunit interface protein
MNIQVNSDNSIEGGEELNNFIENSLTEHFERYKNAITRIEVYLSDENASKAAGNDKRCLLEARISNHQPIVASHHADNIHQAFEAASDKLLRSLDSMVGRLTDRTSPKDLVVEKAPEEEDEDS